jgi:hypothetical protein
MSAPLAALGVAILAVVTIQALRDGGGTAERVAPPPTTSDPAATTSSDWSRLDPEARCASAMSLVTSTRRWPTACRWRTSGELLQGQAFPPPPGEPPFDVPRIELYVDPAQTREDLARAIAHELGHMHHTRDPRFVPDWLVARRLPPETTTDVWTEDYAEVFAALFGPPSPRWRAPTTRPSIEDLAALRMRFFAVA